MKKRTKGTTKSMMKKTMRNMKMKVTKSMTKRVTLLMMRSPMKLLPWAGAWISQVQGPVLLIIHSGISSTFKSPSGLPVWMLE